MKMFNNVRNECHSVYIANYSVSVYIGVAKELFFLSFMRSWLDLRQHDKSVLTGGVQSSGTFWFPVKYNKLEEWGKHELELLQVTTDKVM